MQKQAHRGIKVGDLTQSLPISINLCFPSSLSISHMMSSIPAELQKAIDKSVEAQRELVPSTQRLDDAVRNSKVHGLPPIAIGAAQGSFQAMLCRMMNAKAVLEIGTLGGYA